MKEFATQRSLDITDLLSNANTLIISKSAQNIIRNSPPSVPLPRDRFYVVLSIKHDLGGKTIRGYRHLRRAVLDAGYQCLGKHDELMTYIIDHWPELKAAGFSYLSSTAPLINSSLGRRFTGASLHWSNPCYCNCSFTGDSNRINFHPDGAVLAYTSDLKRFVRRQVPHIAHHYKEIYLMENFTLQQALGVIEPGLDSSPLGHRLLASGRHPDEIYISTTAQQMMDYAPRLSSLAQNRAYTVLSVEQLSPNTPLRGYHNLLQAVASAGYTCLHSHKELAMYALEHWDELQHDGFNSFLMSSAPPFWTSREEYWSMCADLFYPHPQLSQYHTNNGFSPSMAVLASTST